MKFFSLLTVGLSTLAAASPLALRATPAQLDSAGAALRDLYSQVQGVTANISMCCESIVYLFSRH